MAQVASDTGISAPTVRRVLKVMQAQGMLREVTGRARGLVFVYGPFLEILEEGL